MTYYVELDHDYALGLDVVTLVQEGITGEVIRTPIFATTNELKAEDLYLNLLRHIKRVKGDE